MNRIIQQKKAIAKQIKITGLRRNLCWRVMKIELGKLIGSGAGSDVYEYGNDKVCKLYKIGVGSAEKEYNKTLDAYNNGLPAPKVYEIVEHNGRHGIIMERVHGISYLEILLNNIMECHEKGMPNSEIFYSSVNIELIHNTAKVLYMLHQKKCNLIESATESLKTSCKYNRYLTQEEKEIINMLIDRLPAGDSVCHGDPNPGNFLTQNNQIFLIDWNDCVKGNPLYDLTEYALTMKYADVDDSLEKLPEYIINFVREYKDEYTKVFFDYYMKLSNIDISEMDMWLIPMLVSKMGVNNQQKKEAYLSAIRKELRVL
jgi:thiamine kinase-like enzyme